MHWSPWTIQPRAMPSRWWLQVCPTQLSRVLCSMFSRHKHVLDKRTFTEEASLAGLEEVSKRLSNPVRKYMLWDQVSDCAPEPVALSPVGMSFSERHLTERVRLQEVRQGNAAFKTFQQIIRNLLREVRQSTVHLCCSC